MTTSAELQARRVAAVPRGIGNATQIYAERAQNSEIWDVEDGGATSTSPAASPCSTPGHRHPKVIAAVEGAARRLHATPASR